MPIGEGDYILELKDMVDLLHIYDATEDIEQIANDLSGGSNFGHGYDDGIVGKLTRVRDIIYRNSPIYDEFEDFETQPLGKVLNARGMAYEERAKIILGLDEPKTNQRTKYDAIGENLYRTGQDEVTLTFDQMKGILGYDLPKSAYNYSAWWSNTGHAHAVAWTAYGYKTERVNPELFKISFRRAGEPQEPSVVEEIDAKADKLMPIDPASDTVTVCGYDFTYVQDIKPERDKNGNIIEYQPQAEYSNPHGKGLHSYGGGNFCYFTIDAGNWPGVYLWIVDGEIIYIGETVKLSQRFNDGYGTIAGINCYEGGQKTNCKMNKAALELTKAGKTIQLYFFNTKDYKNVEKELLGAINTKYNVKDNR